MKIDRLDFYRAAMPLVSPFNVASGNIYTVDTINPGAGT